MASPSAPTTWANPCDEPLGVGDAVDASATVSTIDSGMRPRRSPPKSSMLVDERTYVSVSA